MKKSKLLPQSDLSGAIISILNRLKTDDYKMQFRRIAGIYCPDLQEMFQPNRCKVNDSYYIRQPK